MRDLMIRTPVPADIEFRYIRAARSRQSAITKGRLLMRRFLVVGCGGSGGKTMAYLMDQLRSDLSKDGVPDLPLGWQFVFLDVPSGVDDGPEGLGSVVDQGGTYVGMGPKGGSYRDLDQTVSQKLREKQAFEGIATWAPQRPESVTRPINVGAGQYRAIGRMILLARAGEVRRALMAAMERINAPESVTSMKNAAFSVGSEFNEEQPTIVLVIGSMAGGSGASMALDVCRLLTQVNGVTAKLISLFMFSADTFDSLPPADRAGVRANALAMLGEIVASQAGAASRHDNALLKALGYSDGVGVPIPFARVFPVSRLMGVQKAAFGDGTMGPIYRGLARGLAGLMESSVASQQFVDFELGNQGSISAHSRYLGWGADPAESIPWGSYGFASLSMGRDRYAEYAAQRIARTCVDRLLDGHLQPGNPASGTEQVNALLDNQWPNICTRLQLPDGRTSAQQSSAELGAWMTTVALPREQGEGTARLIVDRDFAPYVPSPHGQNAAQFRDFLRAQSASRRQVIAESVNRSAYEWAFEWHQGLVRRTQDVVGDAISKLGLPYAGAAVDRLAGHLADFVSPNARVISGGTGSSDLSQLPEDVDRTLSGMRGSISGGDTIVARVVEGVRGKVRTLLYTRVSALVSEGLLTFVSDVLKPLQIAIREAQIILEQARGSQLRQDGLARLETTQYAAWPSDDDRRVPQRFDEANNEILLTSSRQFDTQYRSDIETAIPLAQTGGSPRLAVAAQVMSGLWATQGGIQPPGGLMEQTVGWRSRIFPTDPLTGESLVPSEARFDIHVRPAELLHRARMFVARPEESFSVFSSVSLREYLNTKRESEQQARHRDVMNKFRETLALAMPLISVDAQTVQILHGGNSVEYRYKFSSVPFRNLPIADDLEAILTNNPSTDPSTRINFRKALTEQGNPRRIDVFGSYPLYSPLAFDSVLEPVAQEWESTAPQGRAAYWTYRRARTLDASLAMSDAERRAMVAGWYIGQVVGELIIPGKPFRRPVQIWDPEDGTWVEFAQPLLTPPDRFRAPYDWLPAVLESHLMAIARVQQPPVLASLKPYLLLRELYDSEELGPATGIKQISAIDKLASWITSGSRSGMPSRIPAVAAATTPEERRDAAKRWLVGEGGPGHLAAHDFLPPKQFGATGGSYGIIESRTQASSTPFFRDLAVDIVWATQSLATVVDQAYEQASRTRPARGDDERGPTLPPKGDVF